MSNKIGGIEGTFKIGSVEIKGVRSWTIDLGAEIPDTTSFTDAGWRTFVAGLKSWSGSLEASWDDDATAGSTVITDLFGTSTTATFQMKTGTVFTGTIFIKNVSPSDDVADHAKFGVQFQGSGPLTVP